MSYPYSFKYKLIFSNSFSRYCF